MAHSRWTINGDFLSLAPTGVARYAREVVSALDALIEAGDPATEGLKASLVVKDVQSCDLALRHIRVREARDLPVRVPQAWTQAILPRYVEGGLLSLCNLAPLAISKQILCIHDAHTFVVPESYSHAFRLYNRMVLPLLGRRVAHVTTVSDYSRQLLIDHGIVDRNRISVTYNGHEHVVVPNAASSSRKSGERPYVLTIGRNLAYKNTGLVLGIADALDALGLDLVIAGKFDPARFLGKGQELPSTVRLLGRVSDANLFVLMRDAFCFLFPSRVEGFGLPALEAMAADCPLIVSISPCLPEICGPAAITVDPDDVQGWINAIAALAADPERRQQLIEAGRVRRGQFSWTRIAHHYAQLMRRLDYPVSLGADTAAGTERQLG